MADSRPSSKDRDPGVRIGVMDCFACKRELPVKRKPSGKLSCSCPWCDLPLYVNRGTEAEKLVMARVRLDEPPAAPAEPEAPGKTAPAPAEPAPAAARRGPLFGGSA